MQKISRDQLKEIFSDVKHFRISEDFDEEDFEPLSYYSFFEGTDSVFYMVYEFRGELKGIRWNVSRPSTRPLALGLCDICKKHRKRDEIVSIYAQTRGLPKNVNYRSRGFLVCFDYLQCNSDLGSLEKLDYIFGEILKND